ELKLGAVERRWSHAFLRKSLLLIVLAVVWQVYARMLDNSLLFPTLGETLASLVENVRNGTLPMRTWTSLRVLVIGYAAGVAIAATLTVLAIGTRIGTDFLATMTAMFNPLPAIALFPMPL